MGRLPISDQTYLRLLEDADAAELDRLVDANREYLALWLPWAGRQTLEETRTFIAETRRQVLRNDGFQSAILREERIVGVVGFHSVDWDNRSTSIGYWLSEPSQGKGTMTEAVRTLTKHALSVWELNRVEIQAAVGNRRSRAIPERLGFRKEGTLREAERVGNGYLDSVVYAMLASDWPR
jgi:ribosomal-protein-serine acetyltransferase